MVKLPEERLSDGKRIREIIQAITSLFEGTDLEDISLDNKVFMCFQYDRYPIIRRYTKKSIKVEGYWWLEEHQTLKFAWQGYADAKVKETNGINRIWVKRTFLTSQFLYIRDNGEWVDIEGMTYTTKYVKKQKVNVREWVTCTVPKTYFNNVLDSSLEPAHDICTKHNKGLLDEEDRLGHG